MARLTGNRLLLIVLAIQTVLLIFIVCTQEKDAEQRPAVGAFSFTHEYTLPGTPEQIYDAITGDISGWWDHSFSEKPYKLYIEAKPGGGFYEIFDESGDGVLHATVTAAQRGKLLRFVGPLGLAGNAIDLTNSYTFEALGDDSTRLTLDVHAAGEMEPEWPILVEQVWRHFLGEQFVNYITM